MKNRQKSRMDSIPDHSIAHHRLRRTQDEIPSPFMVTLCRNSHSGETLASRQQESSHQSRPRIVVEVLGMRDTQDDDSHIPPSVAFDDSPFKLPVKQNAIHAAIDPSSARSNIFVPTPTVPEYHQTEMRVNQAEDTFNRVGANTTTTYHQCDDTGGSTAIDEELAREDIGCSCERRGV